MAPAHLSPALPEGVSISVHDVEQDNGGKLSAEVRPKFYGECRNSDRLVLHRYDRVVRNARGRLLRQQACSLRQRNHDVVENIREHEIPSERRTLPEASNGPFDDMVIFEGSESVCDCRDDWLPNSLEHLLIENGSIVGYIGAYG